MNKDSLMTITAVVTDEDGFCVVLEMGEPTATVIMTEAEAFRLIELIQECIQEAALHKN